MGFATDLRRVLDPDAEAPVDPTLHLHRISIQCRIAPDYRLSVKVAKASGLGDGHLKGNAS